MSRMSEINDYDREETKEEFLVKYKRMIQKTKNLGGGKGDICHFLNTQIDKFEGHPSNKKVDARLAALRELLEEQSYCKSITKYIFGKGGRTKRSKRSKSRRTRRTRR